MIKSSSWITNIETSEKFELNRLITIDSDVESLVDEENKGKVTWHFNKGYWGKPITFICKEAYWDLSTVFTNNRRRMYGKHTLPYRKLFKYNKGYALVIFNKQRKYVRDRYTFEEWKKKNKVA